MSKHKSKRNHPLTEEQKSANHLKSKVRVQVEYIYVNWKIDY